MDEPNYAKFSNDSYSTAPSALVIGNGQISVSHMDERLSTLGTDYFINNEKNRGIFSVEQDTVCLAYVPELLDPARTCDLRVVNCWNGVKVVDDLTFSNDSDFDQREQILRKYRFCGISKTNAEINHDTPMTDLALVFGGAKDIKYFCPHTCPPLTALRWDLPGKDSTTGRAIMKDHTLPTLRDKVYIQTTPIVPYDTTSNLVPVENATLVANMFYDKSERNVFSDLGELFKKNMKEFIRTVFFKSELYAEADNRIEIPVTQPILSDVTNSARIQNVGGIEGIMTEILGRADNMPKYQEMFRAVSEAVSTRTDRHFATTMGTGTNAVGVRCMINPVAG